MPPAICDDIGTGGDEVEIGGAMAPLLLVLVRALLMPTDVDVDVCALSTPRVGRDPNEVEFAPPPPLPLLLESRTVAAAPTVSIGAAAEASEYTAARAKGAPSPPLPPTGPKGPSPCCCDCFSAMC